MNAPELPWVRDELETLDERGLLRARRSVTPVGDGRCIVDGRRLLNFASNDYLNLACDPRLAEAAQSALAEAGTGSGASALVCGRSGWHEKLEQKLAKFEGQDAALLFPTGYAANVGGISALAGKDDAIFSDRLNHASLIDGCRLSGAEIRIYDHDNVDGLSRDLKQASGYRRRMIVTDSVFSMDGNVAPLVELCELAAKYEAPLFVDEAHATGVLGEQGRGAAEWLGVEGRIAVRVGTLSKALGTLGGFIAGSRDLIDYLWNRSRTQVFSTALPPAVCAAACAALDIVESEPCRRTGVLARAERLRAKLAEREISVVPGGCAAIVPVILQSPGVAVAVAAQLEERGFLVAAIRPPSVPEGTSRLRISVTAAHSDDDVDRLAGALEDVLSTACVARANPQEARHDLSHE